MIAKFCVPQTRADVQQIIRLALIAAFSDMGDVMGTGDEIEVAWHRDKGMGNVPDDLPDFCIVLMSDAENVAGCRAETEPPDDDDDEIEFSVN